MDEVLTRVCFRMGEISGAQLAEFIEQQVSPEFSEVSHISFLSGEPTRETAVKALREELSPEFLTLRPSTEGASSYFQFARVLHMRMDSLTLRSCNFPGEDWVNAAFTLPGMTVAHACVYGDWVIQNCEDPDELKAAGHSLDGLRFQEEETPWGPQIDTSCNPGVQRPHLGMWVMSSWRMWFNEEVAVRLPADGLNLFLERGLASWREDGVLEVRLYEDASSYGAEGSRELQREFKRLLDDAYPLP